MSPIKLSLLIISLAIAIALVGCGDKNPQAVFNSNSGTHLASWLPAGHAVAAKAHLDTCTKCHGGDFSGGISTIACTQCHLGSEEAPHPIFWNYTTTQPTAWGRYAYAFHGSYVKQKGTTSCAVASCHGSDLLGVAGSGPSCKSCHKDILSIHPVEWTIGLAHSPGGATTTLPDHGPWAGINGFASCENIVCHGPQGDGVFLSGLACSACHNSFF